MNRMFLHIRMNVNLIAHSMYFIGMHCSVLLHCDWLDYTQTNDMARVDSDDDDALDLLSSWLTEKADILPSQNR
jgi:hypothetical protein